MFLRSATFLALVSTVFAQCPNVHVFGARETTVSPGYGTAGVVVNLVLQAYPGSTAEPINYPACGGQASCGGVSYANSVKQGVAAVASQVNSFNQRCPNTKLVLVGYSQGGQIFDDAYCGGGDTNEGITDTSIPISAAAQKQIKAAIFMGDPRHIPGLSYNVGTCNANGVSLYTLTVPSLPVLISDLVCSPSSWLPMPLRGEHQVLL
jgi:acetylxylan esterase